MEHGSSFETDAIISDTYRVVRLIGRGTSSEVYEVRHERTGAISALKILAGNLRDSDDALARFRREIDLTTRLRHPGIVKVFDFDHLAGERFYIAMEMLQGQTLSSLLAGRPLPRKQVQSIADQIASVVSAAHAVGVCHGDLRPNCIFIEPLPGGGGRDLIRILGFGSAKVREVSRSQTKTGALIGAPYYTSPEQALGRASEIGDRSDQFAIAAIVYEMVTGVRAFGGTNDGDDELAPSILYRVVHQPVPPFPSIALDVDPTVERVLARALAKSPAERYPDLTAFGAELHAALAEPEAPASVAPSRSRNLPATLVMTGVDLAEPAVAPEEADPPSGSGAGRTRLLPPEPGRSSRRTGGATVPGAPRRSSRRTDGGTAPARPRGIVFAVGGGVLCLAVILTVRNCGAGDSKVPVAGSLLPEPSAALLPPPMATAVARNLPAPPTAPSTAPSREPGGPPNPVAPAAPINLDVENAPPGVSAWEARARLELPLRLAPDGSHHQITFRAPGFDDLTVDVVALPDRHVSLENMHRTPSRSGTTAHRKPIPAKPKSRHNEQLF